MLAIFRSRVLARPTVIARSNLVHTLSVTQGPVTPPLDTRTLPDFWDANVATRGHRPALICPSEPAHPHGGPLLPDSAGTKHLSWSYGAFNEHIRALAAGLVALGVKKGDRVGVVMGNNSAYATLQWATASIGAILVTFNPAYRGHELIHTLRQVGVSHLFLVPNLRRSAYLHMLHDHLPSLRGAAPGSIAMEELPALRSIIAVDNTRDPGQFSSIMDKAPAVIDYRDVPIWTAGSKALRVVEETRGTLHKDDVINIHGTTGLPKAVSLTHSNLLNNALSISDAMRLTEEDVICNNPPLFHCFGLVLGNLAAWSRGACIVYPDEVFSPPAIVDAVQNHRCTALHGVPAHFHGILAEVEKRQAAGEKTDFSTLRTGIAAGSPVPIELMRKLIGTLNLRDLTNAYGMTETSPVSFQTTPDDSLIARTETVGRVRHHVRAKIVNEHGHIVPVGVRGELCTAGYLLQKGYWGDPEHTAQVMRHDSEGTLWMHTGDEAVLDSEGYLRIVGRVKDLIIRGGENLSPVAIENALCELPAIVEAAAVSVPDDVLGEVVGAWIVLHPGSPIPTRAEIANHVRARMNPQNIPAWVWFTGTDGPSELPRTASGKVQKHILRAWSRDLAAKDVGRVS
ncbi:acetyl-CoA synthetase-like protein [Peniophora sp. CONT]|nr:acetyl-CoA synthetase-like protein [Peniophora sp. CONT]